VEVALNEPLDGVIRWDLLSEDDIDYLRLMFFGRS
jgi:hypothetical protein